MSHPLEEERARAAVQVAFNAVTADDVVVNLRADETAFTRYAVNQVTTSGEVDDVVMSISCAVGGHHATTVVHSLEPSQVTAAARRALELARIAPDDPEFVPSPGAAALRTVEAAWSPILVSADDRAAMVADSITEAKRQNLVAFGLVKNSRHSHATATRRGFFGLHHGTAMELTTTARTQDGHGSGWAVSAGVGRQEVDAHLATQVACDKALRSKSPKPLDPGVYPVVLEPQAVAGLLAMLSFDARAADEGHSPFTKPGGGTRVGEKLLGELNLRSDPWSPVLPEAPFDGDGLPRPPVTWVENGVLKRLRTSRAWAKRTKRPADAGYGGMIPSGSHPESIESLLAGIERGLLVTRFWYIRMLDPQLVTVTGLTRDGLFLVERGKVVGPVNNLRFNQSVVQLFANADGYGPVVRVASEGGEAAAAAPALRCKAFHMASRSDAI